MHNTPGFRLTKTSYDTTLLRGLQAKSIDIAQQIEAIIMINKDNDVIHYVTSDIIAIVGDDSKIAEFQHPIFYKDKMYLDLRHIVTLNGDIKNLSEYNFIVKRAKLELAWQKNKDMFYGQMPFIVDAFSAWVSHGVQRAISASLKQASDFRIATAIYYLGLFSNEMYTKNEDLIIYILKRLPTIIRIPAQNIDDLFTNPELEESLLTLFRSGTSDQPVNGLRLLANTFTLLTNSTIDIEPVTIASSCCGGAFIGPNASNVSHVALENPPTFVAMLFSVFNIAYQKDTAVARAMSGIRKNHSNTFDKFMSEVNSTE